MRLKSIKIPEELHDTLKTFGSKSMGSAIQELLTGYQTSVEPDVVKQLEKKFGVDEGSIPDISRFIESYLIDEKHIAEQKHDEAVTKLSKRAKGIYGAALRSGKTQEDALQLAEEHQDISNIMVNATDGKPNVTLGSIVRAFQALQDMIYTMKLERN